MDNKKDGQYGCYALAAKYCGFSEVPERPYGTWQHGWIPPERNFDPESIVGEDGLSRARTNIRYRVWRYDQVEALKGFGYTNVIAIGSPWLYSGKKEGDEDLRKPGSLLILPVHSLPVNGLLWEGKDYAEYIFSIRRKFSNITVCVHPGCIQVGNWVNAFREFGFDIVKGADINDPEAINKMSDLFKRFEFVSGNEFGSFLICIFFWSESVY